MLDEYPKLIEAYKWVEECKTKASSRESIAELREWLNKEAPNSKYLGGMGSFTNISELNQDDMTRFLLPEAGMLTGKVGNELTGP
jgi:hypothetical protein